MVAVDHRQRKACGDRPQTLADDVRKDVIGGNLFVVPESNGHSWVDVCSGKLPDCQDHDHHSQSESQTDSKIGEATLQGVAVEDCSRSKEYEKVGTDSFGDGAFGYH